MEPSDRAVSAGPARRGDHRRARRQRDDDRTVLESAALCADRPRSGGPDRRGAVFLISALLRRAAGPVMTLAASTVWSGRGQTMTTMYVGLTSAGINIALNYWFIFGGLGLPALGIRGAAFATMSSDAAALCIYVLLLLRHPLRKTANIWLWRWPASEELRRLFVLAYRRDYRCLDLAAFTIFVQIVGRYPATADGAHPQEAANITFAVNALAFIPTMGLGTAVGILCGQAMGAGQATMARRINRLGIGLAACIQVPAALIYWFYPELILQFFTRADDPNQLATLAMAKEFLGYIAYFLLCDGIWMITGSALSGVGDTRFVVRQRRLGMDWLCYSAGNFNRHGC